MRNEVKKKNRTGVISSDGKTQVKDSNGGTSVEYKSHHENNDDQLLTYTTNKLKSSQ